MSDQQYDSNMRGQLFRNDRKEQPNHPDYNGSCEIEGKEYWINAWVKEGKKSGKKFFSFSFKAKEQQSGGSGSQTAIEDDNGEMPF